MREQRTKVQPKKNKKLQDNTHRLSPPPTPSYKSTNPYLSHTATIYNNNTMDIEFVVEMRQLINVKV